MLETTTLSDVTDGNGSAKTLLRAGLCSAAMLLFSTAASAYTVTVFGPAVHDSDTAAMDAVLGVSGALIEDFEDLTLIPGLTEAHGTGNLTLPSPGSSSWDGGNLISIQNAPILFTYAPGATTFGVGISGDQLLAGSVGPETFRINGDVALTFDLADFAEYQVGPLRNGYIRIDAELGDLPITSVLFTSPDSGDTVSFDHLALVQVPEPGTLALLAGALLALSAARRRACPAEYRRSKPL